MKREQPSTPEDDVRPIPAIDSKHCDNGQPQRPASRNSTLIERACDYLQDLEAPFTDAESEELCRTLRSEQLTLSPEAVNCANNVEADSEMHRRYRENVMAREILRLAGQFER